MSENKSVARRYLEEVVSQGRVEMIDEVCAEDYIEYDPAWPGGQASRDHIKQAIPMYKKVLPDLLCRVEDLVAEGDRLTWLEGARISGRHTHGTGCVLSAALAAELARGMAPADACLAAKRFVEHAIAAGREIGAGVGPVDPGWEFGQVSN